MASQLRSRYNLIPAGPSLIARTNYRRAILTRAASLVGTRSLVRIAVSHHSEQPQNRTSHGQTSNHLQYQNPQITQAFLRHRDMHMDINSLSYEELLELEERIGKVNTGIKTSELSKFVKEVICCGEQDEEERCVICLEQYADADVKGQLMCGHEYHFSCIGKWMEEQAVCPICKQRAAQFEQYNC
ncbi:putative E3 ubiquitin-protein ligase HIP1 isoform X1 [Carex rostrata]